MEERIKKLETRLDNLQRAFEQAQKNQVPITSKADSASGAIPPMQNNIAENTSDISDNSEGLFDVADLAGENSDGIFDLAEMVADLEDRVSALEDR